VGTKMLNRERHCFHSSRMKGRPDGKRSLNFESSGYPVAEVFHAPGVTSLVEVLSGASGVSSGRLTTAGSPSSESPFRWNETGPVTGWPPRSARCARLEPNAHWAGDRALAEGGLS
jgi:hypothetical protein